jgi:phosphoribosylaminoimidazolecarboxamide formyltransferase / IMP cyclohydrolase
VRRPKALLSVSDKTGLAGFANGLLEAGYDLLSTGGTHRELAAAGVRVDEVADLTKFPEILDGRVKTLHPKVHGGILARRDLESHRSQLVSHGIEPIDIVAVNLYPFSKVLAQDVSLADAIELIDVGGPTLVRAAAKNHDFVTVVTDPKDYDLVLKELAANKTVSEGLRRSLAVKAFAHTASYDALISQWLGRAFDGPKFPEALNLPLPKRMDLRYGENHHQKAAFYGDPLGLFGKEASVSTSRQLHGKELSYNNILDADTAIEAVKEFEDPSVVIIKHATPSGIASAPTLLQAWKDAYATDTYSPFGGVVVVNRPLPKDVAAELSKVFLELVIAPAFEPEALSLLRAKKNLRLLEVPGLEGSHAKSGLIVRSVTGGVLVQDRDTLDFNPANWKIVTKRQPTAEQVRSLVFAAKCVKHVRSNALVFAKGTKTVGIGGGQTARVDSAMIAIYKGKDNIKGSVVASEAFFPFRDAVDLMAQNGVDAIVQPGGSIRDEEVIQAANEHNMTMMFNNHRSFRH